MYDNFSTHGAICPYCNNLNSCSESDGILYNESIEEYYCDSCGKEFLCSAYVEWSWTTAKIDDKKE